jgi:hypothetical protein
MLLTWGGVEERSRKEIMNTGISLSFSLSLFLSLSLSLFFSWRSDVGCDEKWPDNLPKVNTIGTGKHVTRANYTLVPQPRLNCVLHAKLYCHHNFDKSILRFHDTLSPHRTKELKPVSLA